MSFGDDGKINMEVLIHCLGILGLSFKRKDEIGSSIFQEAVNEGGV